MAEAAHRDGELVGSSVGYLLTLTTLLAPNDTVDCHKDVSLAGISELAGELESRAV